MHAALAALCMLTVALFSDSDGNGKCWQREKIHELHNITHSVSHIEQGSLFVDSKQDGSDFYYFTPGRASTFELILHADATLSLSVGTSCRESKSIYANANDSYHVILDTPLEETLYLHVHSSSNTPTYYKLHLHVSIDEMPATPSASPGDFATTFECVEYDGSITCKR